MLTQKRASESLHVGFVNEHGKEVLTFHASYSEANINITLDMMEPSYCSAHVEEVQTAMTAFLGRLNAALSESELPLIVTA